MAAKRTSAAKAAVERELHITRDFDATREDVFKAWTDPERVKRWWGPKGFTTPFCRIDLRPGGVFHYCMRSPEGRDYWGIGIYREIVEPERIVYTDAFSDAEGRPVPPAHYGMSASHPAETLVTAIFDDRGGKTRLTLHHSIPESSDVFEECRQGWTEMLERLAEGVRRTQSSER